MSEDLDGYRILRRLGDAELSELFAGVYHGDGGFIREVLIKRLRSEYCDDDQALRAFQREAHLLARVRQRSIPHVYDLRRHPDTGAWHIILEYIPGPTLAWVLERLRSEDRALPMPIALTIASQLAGALHHFHEVRTSDGSLLSLVHRNLAPQHILLGRDGIARVTDFSCASPRAELDATGSDGRGSAGYMAPEQILGREAPDRRADVFALGILLYEATTATRLYDGHGERLRRALMDSDAPLATDRRAGFPEGLSEILEHTLARDPEIRPQSAADFQRRVERFAARQKIALGSAKLARYLRDTFPPRSEDVRNVPHVPKSSVPPRRESRQPRAMTHSASGEALVSRESQAPRPSGGVTVPPPRPWTPVPTARTSEAPRRRRAAAPATEIDVPAASADPTEVPEVAEVPDDDTLVGRSPLAASEAPSTRPSQRVERRSSRPSVGVYVQRGGRDDVIKKR